MALSFWRSADATTITCNMQSTRISIGHEMFEMEEESKRIVKLLKLFWKRHGTIYTRYDFDRFGCVMFIIVFSQAISNYDLICSMRWIVKWVLMLMLLLLPLSFNAMTAITIIIINLENQNVPRRKQKTATNGRHGLCATYEGQFRRQDRTCLKLCVVSMNERT